MDYLERLQALVCGLFFEGAGKVIVAFTAAKGHVSFAMACEDGDDVGDASIAWCCLSHYSGRYFPDYFGRVEAGFLTLF